MLTSTIAAAVIGVHLTSVHLQPELAERNGNPEGYNDANPGLYVRTAAGWQAGSYWNSHRKPTFYAGKAWTLVAGDGWDAGVFLAGATGYPAGSVVPMVAASVRVGVIRFTATPRVGDKASAVVHASIEF